MNIFQRIGYRQGSRAFSIKKQINLNLKGEKIDHNKPYGFPDENHYDKLEENKLAPKVFKMAGFQPNPKFLSNKTLREDMIRKLHIRFVITKNNI